MGNGNTTTTAWADLDRPARIEAVIAATVAGLARGWQLCFTQWTGEKPTRELPAFDEDTGEPLALWNRDNTNHDKVRQFFDDLKWVGLAGHAFDYRDDMLLTLATGPKSGVLVIRVPTKLYFIGVLENLALKYDTPPPKPTSFGDDYFNFVYKWPTNLDKNIPKTIKIKLVPADDSDDIKDGDLLVMSKGSTDIDAALAEMKAGRAARAKYEVKGEIEILGDGDKLLLPPTIGHWCDGNNNETAVVPEISEMPPWLLAALGLTEPLDTKDSTPKIQWPEPVDLWGNFEPPELPKGLLPPLIEQLAFTESENMGCDPAGIAMAALTVCAAAIPDAVQLRMKPKSNSWKESARLWTMLVGNVSAKKTPVLNRTTWPIKKIDSELYRQYAAELEAYENLIKEQQQEKNSKQPKQPGWQQPKPKLEKPKQQRVRLEDTTIEAAQEVFADSPNGLLCLQDELSGWFGMMDKYNGGGGAKDRGFWLQSYNGGEYIVNRIKRGALYIQNLSACVLGGIQPDKIRETAADGVDDGLLQRSIPIIMRAATADRDEVQDSVNTEYGSLIEHLNRIWRPDTDLEFDPAAQQVRRELADKHLALMNCDAVSKKFAAHIGKYDGIFGRLCIIFHCIENVSFGNYQSTVTSTVTEQTARKVANFMHDFLLPHAVCFYAGVLGLSDDHESLTKVAEYILANKLSKIDGRTIQRGNRHMRGMKKKNIEDVFDQLDAFGWITKRIDKNRNAFGVVNPKVHIRYAERGKAEAARAAGIREAIATALGKAGQHQHHKKDPES